ncbi:hypothetical protein GCM10022297_01190 [Lactobacillus hamsteri]|uniref:Phage minor structural protein GP20 n=1 Tax=Lactobacillus hamsteri DSM 5661 = JCM 6256 TaxID=1423754 RepID=A0A0R1Y4W2_9LACO|nr:phage scaffolding protein [Lactobacillus hamsteri]KRM37009.1 Phage minor structural protein GP20 [Lactobacillus hamsteri DSM 5661 = JCM 6256]
MKRDQLKELGLSEEQIKSVMNLNGEDINKAKSNNAETVKENESLKAQLAERDKDITSLKKNAKDSEELSNQLADLQGKYKQAKENLTEELGKVKLNSAIDQALTKNHVRNNTAFKSLMNLDNIKLKDDGSLDNFDDQFNRVKEQAPYLIDEGKKQDYEPNSGKPSGTNEIQEMVDVFKGGAN